MPETVPHREHSVRIVPTKARVKAFIRHHYILSYKMKGIKIHLLHVGSVYVGQGVPYGNASMIRASGLFESRKQHEWLPVSAYLIEHPEGLVLVDTGWSRSLSPDGTFDRQTQVKQLGPLLYAVSKAALPPGESAAEQLHALGYEPSDLDYIILTHLDADHVSGLRDLAAAKNILVSRAELEAGGKMKNRIRYVPSMWKGINLTAFDYATTGIGPFGRSYDLFGDGSVELVDIAGHSAGLCGVLVRRKGRFVLIFSDGGYSSRSWQEMIMPGPFDDKTNLRKSLEWIRLMSLDSNCIGSWANHDPNLDPQTIII